MGWMVQVYTYIYNYSIHMYMNTLNNFGLMDGWIDGPICQKYLSGFLFVWYSSKHGTTHIGILHCRHLNMVVFLPIPFLCCICCNLSVVHDRQLFSLSLLGNGAQRDALQVVVMRNLQLSGGDAELPADTRRSVARVSINFSCVSRCLLFLFFIVYST